MLGTQEGVRQVYLLGTAFAFLSAFTSFYVQSEGLYGSRGLLPACGFLRGISGETIYDKVAKLPTLLWFHESLELSVSQGLDFVSGTGTLLSIAALLSWRFRNRLVFALLWCCYFSLYQIGQTFLHFQWDILLLEAGFLAIWVAPWFYSRSTSDEGRVVVVASTGAAVPMMMVRWLFFRLMYLAGIVKLTSGCPTWWGLTALNVHYESQCIPTPLAWFAHHLPQWIQTNSVMMTLVIEIGLPFLFFAPSSTLRIFGALPQIMLMTLIFLTGNYNFFNIFTAVLAVSALYDFELPATAFFRRFTSSVAQKSADSALVPRLPKQIEYLLGVCAIAAIAYILNALFNVGNGSLLQDTKLSFSPSQFATFLTVATEVGVALGGVCLCVTIFATLIRNIYRRQFFRFLDTAAVSVLLVGVFMATTVTFVSNDSHHRFHTYPLWDSATSLEETVRPFEIANSYGLFRRMTGVGGRPEVSISGSNDSIHWIEYNFKYKTDNVDEMPAFCAPHQPRLDWQMWFAALGRVEHNLWLQVLAIRLLEGEPSVLALMGQQPPQLQTPPKYVQMNSWTYHYTNYGSKNWWNRTQDSGQYLIPVGLKTHSDVIKQINTHVYGGLSECAPTKQGSLARVLTFIRQKASAAFDWLPIVLLVVLALVLWTSTN
eukprot:m.211127 g.211127  ORF g.211127 m.211127 type:complete len:656 (+) comp15056_c0_seq1:97-2064(+)